jgi:hypothetical protein
MRNWVLTVALFAVACGGGNDPRVPLAKLSVPACVAAGSNVKLDGTGSTDPDGRIARYVFSVDGQVKLANNQPFVILPSSEPKITNGQFQQYAVRLTVIDDDGFEAHAQANFFVVHDVSQCPEGPPPMLDIVSQDLMDFDVVGTDGGDDLVEYDVGYDAQPMDISPADLPLPPDGSGICPNVTGTYRVQVFCFGTLHLELELSLQQQDGCLIVEEYGLVEGSVDETGQVMLSSTFSDLNMDECKGVMDDPENFALECSSGCTAVFLAE